MNKTKTAMITVCGRPNVGKSMLFNKLTGRRAAIVEDTPGVTRDRVYADCVRYNTAQCRPNGKYQNKGIILKASLPGFFILRFRISAPQIRRTS